MSLMSKYPCLHFEAEMILSTERVGGVELNSKSVNYGDNTALAALKKGVAFLLPPPRNVFPSKSERTNQNKITMRKNNSFVTGVYEAPSCQIHNLCLRRLICLSDGDLLQGYYSNEGSAGIDITEESGGSLF